MQSHLIDVDLQDFKKKDTPIRGKRLVSLGEVIQVKDDIFGRVVAFDPEDGVVMMEWSPNMDLSRHDIGSISQGFDSGWKRMEMPDLAFVGYVPPKVGGRVVVLDSLKPDDVGSEGEISSINEFSGQVQVHLSGRKETFSYSVEGLRRSFLSREVFPVVRAEFICSSGDAKLAALDLFNSQEVDQGYINMIPPAILYVLQTAIGFEREHLGNDLEIIASGGIK